MTDYEDRLLRDARAKVLTWHRDRGLADEQIKAFLAGWDEAVIALRRLGRNGGETR